MFADRVTAAMQLVQRLRSYQDCRDVEVVGLARGGVVIAKAVADHLHLPRDVVVIKKISPPFNPELAIGAVAPDGVRFIDRPFAQSLNIDKSYLQEETNRKSQLVKQKMQLYRKGKPPFSAGDKTIIIVDDGAATGATIQAAILWLKKKRAKHIVVALPVAPAEVVEKIKPNVDELIILDTPSAFGAVGEFYEHFDQVEDNEVVQLLA
ncbi:phosphoribosyltransferase [Candidatus Gottesmanbacteria bacterium]|nr:phosphoribosyltransferase [Candidatus Gottesmanbacteria bacterium]